MAVTPARDRDHDVAPRNPCARSVIRRTSSGVSVTSAAGAPIDAHLNRPLRHFPTPPPPSPAGSPHAAQPPPRNSVSGTLYLPFRVEGSTLRINMVRMRKEKPVR